MKQKKIVYCRLGLSNCYEDRIEVNKNLKDYPILENYVIQHELGHNLNSFDLPYEFHLNFKAMPSLFWFVLKNPSTWIDFFPVQYRNKKIIYDPNMFLLYIILISLCFVLKAFF